MHLLKKEDGDYLLVEKPVTINARTDRNYPDRQPTFYLIPRGMVEKIETIP